MKNLACLALALSACVTTTDEDLDLDDAIEEEELGKADQVQAYRHYLLVSGPMGEMGTGRWLVRAGGGRLRCPDDVVRERCEIGDWDMAVSPGLHENPVVLVDELETTPMIGRGRLVRSNGRVYLRLSAVTRGITSVMPSDGSSCYRIIPSGNYYALTKLDAPATVIELQTLYFDDVDPTPDFWGQPTPAVQADIDAALELVPTRPVYTCAWLDDRDSGLLVWANQLFAPR